MHMRITALTVTVAAIVASLPLTACSVAPKAENRETFVTEAKAARQWFATNVKSFNKQIGDCGGYIIFPNVGRAGVVFFGGTFGRGAVYDASGTQIGWARVGSGTFGLQLGAQGYKMAMILEDHGQVDRRRRRGGCSVGGSTARSCAAGQHRHRPRPARLRLVCFPGRETRHRE